MKNSLGIYIVAAVLLAVISSTACQKVEVPHQFPLAEQHNIDENRLITAFAAFRQVAGAISMIVARDGEIIAEVFTYYNNYGPDNTKNVMPVSKSFTGMLSGLAIDKGYIESINDPISKYLGGIVTFPDAVKANIIV